jgi:hypothetical protein
VGQVDLKYLIDFFQLEDIWRRRNPDKLEFSWESRGKKSRIDYFLISQFSDYQVKDTCHLNAPFSDHKPVLLNLSLGRTKRGPGMWKMNVNVIRSTLFQKAFLSMWEDWVKQKARYELRTWWDLGKKRIKELAQNISKILADQKTRTLNQINNRLTFLREREGDSDEIKQLEMKLKNLYEEKGQGAKIRSRAKWWEEGEKSTKYFHSLEKKKGKTSFGTVFQIETWIEVTDADRLCC